MWVYNHQPEVIKWILPIVDWFLPLLWRVYFVEYLVALLFLFWILSLCVSIASLWDSSSVISLYENFHKTFWSWWVYLILSNRSSCMQKYSWLEKGPPSFSGIPIKVHPSFLSNYNCSWSMINIFFRYSSYISRLPYFSRYMVFDTWILFLICFFPILQYTF